ncbi:hypothetical protein [Nocardioides sp. LML1-1-1.1]|uniref:hypothetical protein n=1 Tax=Nocardioides sp. LML1-1-1.1 TaxID=3135248 RepID=UPI0034136252
MKPSPRRPALRTALAVLALAGAGAVPVLAGPATAAADTCVQGTLKYTSPDAESQSSLTAVVPRAKFEVRSGSTVLTTGETAADGTFSACTGKTSVSDLQVSFVTTAAGGRWRVIDDVVQNPTSSDLHRFSTATTSSATGTTDYGVVQPPADQQGAFRVLAVLDKLYNKRDTSSTCFAKIDTGTCETLTFVWDSDRTVGGWWDHESDDPSYVDNGEVRNSKYVVLDKWDQWSQHTIIHEAGHWLQWQLHGQHFPAVNACDPHYMDQASSESCAWTEGFADAVAGKVLGDRRYVYADANVAPSPFEPTDCTPTPGGDCFWTGGRATQGNVAAAMLDFWAADGGWNSGFAAMASQTSATVKAYYEHRYPSPSSTVSGIYSKHGLQYTNNVG